MRRNIGLIMAGMAALMADTSQKEYLVYKNPYANLPEAGYIPRGSGYKYRKQELGPTAFKHRKRLRQLQKKARKIERRHRKH